MLGAYPWKTCAVVSGRSTRVSVPSLPNRHSSTRSATSEKTAKFVPVPSYDAPRGKKEPGHRFIGATVYPQRCAPTTAPARGRWADRLSRLRRRLAALLAGVGAAVGIDAGTLAARLEVLRRAL